MTVSRPALMARLNRKLAEDDRQIKAARGARAVQECGDFYLIDTHVNGLISHHVDPVELARKLGVLKPYEKAEGF